MTAPGASMAEHAAHVTVRADGFQTAVSPAAMSRSQAVQRSGRRSLRRLPLRGVLMATSSVVEF